MGLVGSWLLPLSGWPISGVCRGGDRLIEAATTAQEADGAVIPLNEVHLRAFVLALSHNHESARGDGPQQVRRIDLLAPSGGVGLLHDAAQPAIRDGDGELLPIINRQTIAASEAREGVVGERDGLGTGSIEIDGNI